MAGDVQCGNPLVHTQCIVGVEQVPPTKRLLAQDELDQGVADRHVCRKPPAGGKGLGPARRAKEAKGQNGCLAQDSINGEEPCQKPHYPTPSAYTVEQFREDDGPDEN